jgi:hypothetical protein
MISLGLFQNSYFTFVPIEFLFILNFRVRRKKLDGVVCYNYSIYYLRVTISDGNLNVTYNKRYRGMLVVANRN